MISQEKINELTDNAKKIRTALKSNPKDEKTLVNILNSTTNSERQIIRTCYKRLYNKPIQQDIKNELTNNFKELCLSMFDTPYEYDSRELYRSLNTTPIKDKIIIEIFSSRNKSHLNIVDQAYEQFFKISLKEDIKKKLSKNFSKFLLTIMDTDRDELKNASYDEAYKYAQLIKDNKLNLFEDENIFKNIFLEKSREDLILISRAFFELNNINLYDYIKVIKNGEIEENNKILIKNILFYIISPSEWFSKKIKKAISEQNTDFEQINRILINRCNNDMDVIRDYYLANNGIELYKDIQNIAFNSYGEVITNLCMK